MNHSPADSPAPLPAAAGESARPLSYAELRRWLGLVVLTVFGAALVWALETVCLLFALVFLLAMVLNPVVVALERRGIKRGIAVGLLALAAAGLLALGLWLVAPRLLDQAG